MHIHGATRAGILATFSIHMSDLEQHVVVHWNYGASGQWREQRPFELPIECPCPEPDGPFCNVAALEHALRHALKAIMENHGDLCDGRTDIITPTGVAIQPHTD